MVRACFVIFGARLRPDGSAGPALVRRVAGALAAAAEFREPYFLVTGGQPRCGVTEASAMQDLLRNSGVSTAQILVDDRSRNTRASAISCAAILRSRGDLAPVYVCSDRFHQARCTWLLRLAGIMAEAAPMPDERRSMNRSLWAFYQVRELIAIVYDTVAILARR